MSDAHDAQFRFDRSALASPRPPGISAIMRIKNGADFLRLSIESHLPYVDEVVACYNDCSDATPQILAELAAQYPGKVRPIEYLPKVHPVLSAEHAATPTESLHAVANYYNFALSQARFSYATKLDDDHLAMPVQLSSAVASVLEAAQANRRELFTFSGLNVAYNQAGQLGMRGDEPFAGTGDHLFFPVCEQVYFVQEARMECFRFDPPRLYKRYVGLLYFHLKHLKPGAGYQCLDEAARTEWQAAFAKRFRWQSFADFSSPASFAALKSELNAAEYWLRTQAWSHGLIHWLSGRNPPQKIARLARLSHDLKALDFQRDLLDRLQTSH